MKFRCPRCPQDAIDLREGVCPGCGFSLTLGEVIHHYWQRLRGRCWRPLAVQCPKCGTGIPLNAEVCPNCQAPFTVASALTSVLDPPRRRWLEILHRGSPTTKLCAQWLYMLASLVLLGWLLDYAAVSLGKDWITAALLSVVYLAAFGFVFVVFARRQVVQRFSRRTPRLMKLAFIVNYLTCLLLLQVAIGEWWDRALILGGLLITTYLGAMALSHLLWPALREVRGMYAEGDKEQFSPSQPQGRRGRLD